MPYVIEHQLDPEKNTSVNPLYRFADTNVQCGMLKELAKNHYIVQKILNLIN